MTDKADLFHPEVVYAFAAAWASIDGKLDEFETDKSFNRPNEFGFYEGYMYEASELLQRASNRITSFDLRERLSLEEIHD